MAPQLEIWLGDFPGGPGVKNPPTNAGDAGLIPGRVTKITHAAGQVSSRATTREKPVHHKEEPALRPDTAKRQRK